jgi:hypothetical protein
MGMLLTKLVNADCLLHGASELAATRTKCSMPCVRPMTVYAVGITPCTQLSCTVKAAKVPVRATVLGCVVVNAGTLPMEPSRSTTQVRPSTLYLYPTTFQSNFKAQQCKSVAVRYAWDGTHRQKETGKLPCTPNKQLARCKTKGRTGTRRTQSGTPRELARLWWRRQEAAQSS